jgi:quercetin dioxygenase-like cupin family protein
MNLYVEKRSTCNAGNVPKHFHPAAGTLVYVLDGVSQSKSSGEWKLYTKGEYWFERTDWVHGGEADTPELEDVCTDLLVIRVVDKDKDHTVFIK